MLSLISSGFIPHGLPWRRTRSFLFVLLTVIFSPCLESMETVNMQSSVRIAQKDFSKSRLKKGKAKRKKRKQRRALTSKKASVKRDLKSNPFLFEWPGRESAKPLKARGVILKFHYWPNSKQNHKLLQILEAEGLGKTKAIESFKIWLFEWSGDLRSHKKALHVCENLPEMSSLDYCEPNSLLPVRNSKKREYYHYQIDFDAELKDLEEALVEEAEKKTEAGFNAECPYCKENSAYDLLQSITGALSIRTCGLISDSRGLMAADRDMAQLSDYWAQEMIGADLLREEVEKIPVPEKEPFIAVFDNGSHGRLVKNLITNKRPEAILPRLNRKTAPLLYTSYSESFVVAADKLKSNPPSFINNSMGWSDSQSIYEAFQTLSPPAVVVVAAGNIFPQELEKLQVKASKDFDVVLVGSFSPNGFVSEFSQSGEEVHILAPSDEYLTSSLLGEKKGFKETSGAAPLVTASLAGFEWLSGYHPTAEESKLLLEKTAIPTAHSHEEPQRNGVGLLNSYKLGMVGKRLKKKCKGRSDSCFQEEIANDENYRFEVDKGLEGEIAEAFPACALKEIKKTPTIGTDCEDKKKSFKKLRKAVLLNPEEKNLWEALSCIYKEAGFFANGKALERIALSVGSKEETLYGLRSLIETGKTSLGALRAIAGIGGPEAVRILKDRAHNLETEEDKEDVMIVTRKMKPTEGAEVLNSFIGDENPDIKTGLAYSAREVGALDILDNLSKDPNKEIRKIVANVVGWAEGSSWRDKILERLADDPDADVKSAAQIYLKGK